MKLNSQLIAQSLILAFLAIAVSSGNYANKLYKENDALQAQAKQAKADEEVQKNYAAEIAQYLSPDTNVKSISESILELKEVLFFSSIENQIEMPNALALERLNGKGTLSSVYEKVPGTEVTFVRFKVDGTYTHYENFLKFIADIQKMPISITSIRVEGKKFEIGLKAYGK